MISKSGHGFRKRLRSNNKVERDDDSKKSHPTLVWSLSASDRLCGRPVNRISDQNRSGIKGFRRPFEPALHPRRLRRIQAKFGFGALAKVDETKLNPLIRRVSSRIVFKRCRAPGTTKGKGVVFAFVNTCPR